jgi:hypothetical protein
LLAVLAVDSIKAAAVELEVLELLQILQLCLLLHQPVIQLLLVQVAQETLVLAQIQFLAP